MPRTTICNCGHINGLHSEGACRACSCNHFARASDAQAAILAGMERKRLSVAAANEARRNYREQEVNRQ